MRNLPKSVFSLFIALLFIAVLLILPDADLSFKNQLSFLAKSNNAAIAFGHYFVRKIISGVLVLLLTIAVSIIGHRVLKKYKNEF
jgi:energy-coupling factor transporter transmembrane protein EcfT